MLFVGWAQEKAGVWRTQRRHNPATGGSYTWLVRSSAFINFFGLGAGTPIVFSHGWPLTADAWGARMYGTPGSAALRASSCCTTRVDRKPKTIRRTTHEGAQPCNISLGKAATTGHELTVACTYRILVQRHGHLLYLDLPRPT